MAVETLYKQIENDVIWNYESQLENKAKNSINKLKQKWKLSESELNKIYNTNYKKLLSWNINSVQILTNKISQLDSLTNKLIAKYLSKSLEKTKDPWYKGWIYFVCWWIDSDIRNNGKIKNIAKWVIDEIISIPEMFAEVAKHPIETWKALYNALIKNFSWTMKEIAKQYGNIFSGLWTPEAQYKTWRSAALIILTFLPGWAAKWLSKITTMAKNTLKSTWRWIKKAGTAIVKWEVKETTKNVMKKWKEAVKKKIEPVKERLNNNKLKNELNSMNKRLEELKKDPTKNAKEIKELEKNIRLQRKDLNQSNSRLWLDNNRIARKKQGMDRLEKSKQQLEQNKKSLAEKQKALATEKAKPTPDSPVIKNLEREIKNLESANKRLEKSIAERTKVWQNYDVRINRTPKKALRERLMPNLLKKWFSKEGLKSALTSPKRLPLVKSIREFLKARKNIKRFKQKIESIDAQLNKKWKNWKTALENVKGTKTPNFGPYKRISELIKQKESIQRAIDKTASIWEKKLRESILRWALDVWIINKVTQEASNSLMREETLHELLTYLSEDNEENITSDKSSGWLETWMVDVRDDMAEIDELNGLTEEELRETKIIITWKASKTWSREINERIAEERANNMKKKLLEKYPWLKAENLEIRISLQSQDSTDDLSERQWVDLKTTSENKTYVDWYDKVVNQYSSN